MAGSALALLSGAGNRPGQHSRETGSWVIRLRGRGGARAVQARRRELSFWAPVRRAGGSSEGVGLDDPVIGDNRGGGPMAGGARRGRDYRAGPRGGRTPRHVPVG